MGNNNINPNYLTIERDGKNFDYFPLDELYNAAEKDGKLIAIAGQQQVKEAHLEDIKKGKLTKKNKKSFGKWDKYPKGYKGIQDTEYGTAIRCDYYESLNLNLVVIDLDDHSKENDVPISVIKSHALKLIERTYCTETPSGGLHIYLLSKKKPEANQPSINIDYQANTGKGNGKYVITNFRWNIKGEFKEHYRKLPESDDNILIVDSSDEILKMILNDLETSGHIKNEETKHIEKIIKLLKPFVDITQVPSRQFFSCAIAGYLKKQGYEKDTVLKIVQGVFKDDEEYEDRVQNVELTFNKEDKDIIGWKVLKKYLHEEAQNELLNLTKTDTGNIKTQITKKLVKNKLPSVKLLADYCFTKLNLYRDPKTFKYYEKLEDGAFIEIDENRIIEFLNMEFGANLISSTSCEGVLKFITNPIEKDYNLLEFTNGILNTLTKEFTDDKSQFDKIPKLSLPFKWNPEAKGGIIKDTIDIILGSSKYPNDEDLWLRAVGHTFMGYNRIGKIVIVTGPSKSGKSTLNEILKRIFNYSSIPTSVINANGRFTLISMIDKDINIDDDINNGILKSIGFLNTVITGNGFEVELKGLNKSVSLNNPHIPRLFASGNTLPPVFGEGWETRLLLIHAPRVIPKENRDDGLQNDIQLGRYDKDMEWLVYTSINHYWEKMNKPLLTDKQEATMKLEHEFKSDPLKQGIGALFIEDFEFEGTIPVKDVNHYVKEWCKWAYKNNKISKEHVKPSTSDIKEAMNKAGYSQGTDHTDEKHGIRKSIKVYEDIKLNELFYNMMIGK